MKTSHSIEATSTLGATITVLSLSDFNGGGNAYANISLQRGKFYRFLDLENGGHHLSSYYPSDSLQHKTGHAMSSSQPGKIERTQSLLGQGWEYLS